MLITHQHVLILSDRFIDPASPDNLDRQERLLSCIALVSIVYLTLSLTLVRINWAKECKPIRLTVTDIAFESALSPIKRADKGAPVKPAVQQKKPPDSDPKYSKHTAGAATGPTLPPVTELLKTPRTAQQLNQRSTPVTNKDQATISNTNTGPAENPASNQPTTGLNDKLADQNKIAAAAIPPPVSSTNINTDKNTEIAKENLKQNSGPSLFRNHIDTASVRGDIKPYRDELVRKLIENWPRVSGDDRLTLLLVIDKTGQLIDTTILSSNGKRAERRANAAIKATAFAPLPDWYKGDNLSFKLDISTENSGQASSTR